MIARRLALASLALALVLPISVAQAEVAAWDAAKVGEIAKQLGPATDALYDAVYKQPPPMTGSGQRNDFYRLKQRVRQLQYESRQLAGAVGKGEGHDETLPIYEDMMETVRDAREYAARVFATKDLQDKAAAVRGLLNQLGPFYDPDFHELQPVTR
jgi:hypothetical protein